jgi:hypothetical protein
MRPSTAAAGGASGSTSGGTADTADAPITVPVVGHRIAVLWRKMLVWYEGQITAIRVELNSRNKVDQYHVDVLYDDGDKGSHALKTTQYQLLGLP